MKKILLIFSFLFCSTLIFGQNNYSGINGLRIDFIKKFKQNVIQFNDSVYLASKLRVAGNSLFSDFSRFTDTTGVGAVADSIRAFSKSGSLIIEKGTVGKPTYSALGLSKSGIFGMVTLQTKTNSITINEDPTTTPLQFTGNSLFNNNLTVTGNAFFNGEINQILNVDTLQFKITPSTTFINSTNPISLNNNLTVSGTEHLTTIARNPSNASILVTDTTSGLINRMNFVDLSTKGIVFNSTSSPAYSLNLTINWSLAKLQIVTLTGNSALTLSNGQAGAIYMLKLIQDATGTRTITFTNVKLPGAVTPVLTSTANAVDFITFNFDGTNYNLIGVAFDLR